MGDLGIGDIDRALVVGLGRSGRAAVDALVAAGVTVIAADENHTQVPAFEHEPDEVHIGVSAVDHLDDVDLLVPSPGVPEHAPLIAAALGRGIEIWSEPELGFRLAPHRVIGITGTNGKTSVTELTTAMLTEAGIDARACGNIGNAFTDAAREAPARAILVAELSSFQLRFCHALRAEVGVLLNVEPDHLDWHGTFAAYGAAKARMWQAQEEGDWAVVNAEDTATTSLAAEHAERGVAYFAGSQTGSDGPGVVALDGRLHASLPGVETDLLDLDRLGIDAPHHRSNVAASACAALLAGADPDSVGRAAIGFVPGPHRLEIVARAEGLTFVDDSKATNLGAAVAALRSFPSVVWIAGGLAKGVDLSPLGSELGNVRHAVLIGEAAPDLAVVCGKAGIATTQVASMEDAVSSAVAAAEPGDTILLAPACASFDMFRDYAERGERFVAAVEDVTGALRGDA